MNILINVMSHPFFISGLIITLAGLWFAAVSFRQYGIQMRLLRDWVSREEWAGKIMHVPLESWLRTGTTRGEYSLYECHFFADLGNKRKKHRAHVAVKSNDIHRLKKGLTLTVKHSDDNPLRMAVMSVFD
ncbi:hypothetical protein TUM17576_38490 [Enterobacter hormaechei]|uniref:DUF3592 domain-containing protein n=1 Tax=Phytobacter ursingii TaxID=1972431 RepID=A0AB35RUE6_9ENTR|nr:MULTISPECIES: hypothetical protein [Enterobacteriaceae]MDV2864506.1 hypothetical protein [Phytobacter ursingii]GJL37029.1 hypothetical protein TUM17576_38490 [Enterobacter hormaechei]